MSTLVTVTRKAPLMLASPSGDIPLDSLTGTHIFDVKLDGVRAQAFIDTTGTVLLNRSGTERTHTYPELIASAPRTDVDVILDGEIVARTGKFEDIARRDKQSRPGDVARGIREIPVCFLAFDILHHGEQDLTRMPYRARRLLLESFMAEHSNTHWGATIVSNDPSLLTHVASIGMEGIIAKRAESRYRAGRSKDWLKYKVTHRLTCIAVGYEPGEGSRQHFGAMYLAMVTPDGDVVSVGKVGTGFTTEDTWECKNLLDTATPFVVEIEVANVTRAGQLRFPVYKGIRSDLSVGDATSEQLGSLPTT